MADPVVQRRPVRPRCPHGGTAPCVDDLCHNSGGPTLCGIWLYDDDEICQHGYYADTCDQGCADESWDYEEEPEPAVGSGK